VQLGYYAVKGAPNSNCNVYVPSFQSGPTTISNEQTNKSFKPTSMGSGTYGSFDDVILLARYFVNTIAQEDTFSVIFLQSHQLHHPAPEVALTVRSVLLSTI